MVADTSMVVSSCITSWRVAGTLLNSEKCSTET